MTVTEQDLLSCSVHLSQDKKAVTILDQTLLPGQTVYRNLTQAAEMFDAIKTLAVRGAPAIGIFAGYSMYVLSLGLLGQTDTVPEFLSRLKDLGDYLVSSRPTAVNLSWAVRRMLKTAQKNAECSHSSSDSGCFREQDEKDKASDGRSLEHIVSALRAESLAIHREDIEMCYRIAEYGLSLVKPGDGILTHCNAGPLATSKYGTATGPIFLGKERGIDFHVFSDETRPLLQGARLTSYELQKAGVDVTLICDNMASMVMKNGWVQACFVGCDRIAANGDFANKIGTSGVAILAKHYGIPFYTLGPSSTVDLDCPTGDDIHIELRDPDEIRTMWYKDPMALPEVKCYNPSFDVTDHSLVTAIITDKGIVYPPFDVNLPKTVLG